MNLLANLKMNNVQFIKNTSILKYHKLGSIIQDIHQKIQNIQF
jgi:hypothetical protein